MRRIILISCLLFLVAVFVVFPNSALAAVVQDCGTYPETGIPVPTAFCNPGIPAVCRIPFIGTFLAFCGPAASFAGTPGGASAVDAILAIVAVLLAIVGALAVLFAVVGGFRYITAHGNEEQAEAAKKTIQHAILGIVIVILSFSAITIISNILVAGVP